LNNEITFFLNAVYFAEKILQLSFENRMHLFLFEVALKKAI